MTQPAKHHMRGPCYFLAVQIVRGIAADVTLGISAAYPQN
jgi:hypothetical protein